MVGPAATDVDAASETTTSGRPWAGGTLPSWPGPNSSSATVQAAVRRRYVHTSVLECNVVVGERVNRTGNDLTLSRDLRVV